MFEVFVHEDIIACEGITFSVGRCLPKCRRADVKAMTCREEMEHRFFDDNRCSKQIGE